jgi:hypothetical protein
MLLETAKTVELSRERLGALLLLFGLLVQFQPFPFLGGLVRSEGPPRFFQPILLQLFPALAAAPLFIRLDEGLRSDVSFKIFGACALASSLLATVSGFFQERWRSGVLCWISASLCLSLGATAFASPKAGLLLLVTTVMGATALIFGFASLEEKAAANPATQARALWAKVLLFAGIATATGVVGSASAGSGIGWIASNLERPAIAAVSGAVLLIWAIYGWRLAWKAAQVSSASNAPWRWILLPLFFVVMGTGLVWDGTLTGEALPERMDRVYDSITTFFFHAAPEGRLSSEDLITVSIIYWTGFLLAIGCAYWISQKREKEEDSWKVLRAKMPGAAAMIASGYGVDRLVSLIFRFVTRFSRAAQSMIDERFWVNLVPSLATQGLRATGRAAARTDERQSKRLSRIVSETVEVPGKVLQLIQNGDVRWYVLFATGMGVSILVHFLLSTRG